MAGEERPPPLEVAMKMSLQFHAQTGLTQFDGESKGVLGCKGYSPDIQAQGDCRNCGHTYDAHQALVQED